MELFIQYLNNGIDTEQMIIFGVVGICIWLLLREVKCWYYKINTLIRNQEMQIEMMDALLFELRTQNIRRKVEAKQAEEAPQETPTEETKSTP